MSNTKKSATLGMPHGTASHRLRKNILFHLLKKHGENYCFKCSELIDVVDDLSVEHKKPWEGISADLFWDLENIAFSHLACNRPHRSAPGNPQMFEYSKFNMTKNAPEGQAWCGGHKTYRDVSEFHSNERNPSGYASYCKECRKVRLD